MLEIKLYPLNREQHLSGGPKESNWQSVVCSRQYLGQDKYFV